MGGLEAGCGVRVHAVERSTKARTQQRRRRRRRRRRTTVACTNINITTPAHERAANSSNSPTKPQLHLPHTITGTAASSFAVAVRARIKPANHSTLFCAPTNTRTYSRTLTHNHHTPQPITAPLTQNSCEACGSHACDPQNASARTPLWVLLTSPSGPSSGSQSPRLGRRRRRRRGSTLSMFAHGRAFIIYILFDIIAFMLLRHHTRPSRGRIASERVCVCGAKSPSIRPSVRRRRRRSLLAHRVSVR